MELTIFFGEREEEDEDGQRGDQGRGHQAGPVGTPCGVWDRNTPMPTVSTRDLAAADQEGPEVLVPLLM